jgi:polysaccharide biosynthesis protein PslH
VKILWVKAGGLLPLDSGGKIRSYNILRELAKLHEVTYFGFHAEQESAAHDELRNIFAEVVCSPLNLPPAKSLTELAQYSLGILSRDPYAIRKYCRPPVAKQLRQLVLSHTYDVIICDFLVAAGVIPWDVPVPKVLFTHNVEAVIWKRHYEVARNPFWKMLSWREWRAMEGAETRYVKQADLVLAVSQADSDAFAHLVPAERLAVITTGVDIDYFSPNFHAEEENTLVFTGSMDWMPNEDGIFYFTQEILPLIARQIPSVKLTVVGRKPSRRLQTLASQNSERVKLTGWVEDVRPYLAKGAVCIVPLRVGSGTRLKIFEAMSMAKAVVSTTIGAEGLPVKQGSEVFLADTPEQFADQTVQLLRDANLRHDVGLAARHLVEARYSWASVAQTFTEALHRVAPGKHDPVTGKPLSFQYDKS